MKITVRYFALLRERMGCESEVLSFDSGAPTLGRLREQLAERTPVLAGMLRGHALLAAVNREYATADTRLEDGDEVAFFPPVTGG